MANVPNAEQDKLKVPSELGRSYTLRPITMLAIIIVVLCAISLAYLGGVMSGRASAEVEYQKAEAEAEKALLAEAKEVEEGDGGILPPEELEFYRVLRNSNLLPGKEKQAAAQAMALSKPQNPPAPKPLAAPPISESPAMVGPTGLSDYVFQVAALKNEDSADALRQRLEGRGLRTYLKRQGQLLLIQVKLRGDVARSKELMQILNSLHLGQPILISQKPAVN